jgi:hypothetical protein
MAVDSVSSNTERFHLLPFEGDSEAVSGPSTNRLGGDHGPPGKEAARLNPQRLIPALLQKEEDEPSLEQRFPLNGNFVDLVDRNDDPISLAGEFWNPDGVLNVRRVSLPEMNDLVLIVEGLKRLGRPGRQAVVEEEVHAAGRRSYWTA